MTNQIEQLRRVNATLEWVATHQHRLRYTVGYSLDSDVFYVNNSKGKRIHGTKFKGRTYDCPVEAAIDAWGRIRNSALLQSDPPVSLWNSRMA